MAYKFRRLSKQGQVVIKPTEGENITLEGEYKGDNLTLTSKEDINIKNLIQTNNHIPLEIKMNFRSLDEAITQEKSVLPTKQIQEITSDDGKDFLSKVTVAAIPNEYIIPTGKIQITDLSEHDITNYSRIQVVDEDLIASNIVKGVSILGVEGSFEGSSFSEADILEVEY